MKRLVRITVFLLLLLAAALLASSVGVVMPRSFQVTGPDGAPTESWVAYIYRGYRLNFVDSISWSRAGGIQRSARDGVIRLPILFYFKRPLDGWLRHDVQAIYAPTLHATLNIRLPHEGAVLTVSENSADPAAWEWAFGEIYSLISYDLAFGRHERYAVAPETLRMLVREVAADYRALLATHGDRRREMPKEIPAHLRYASEQERTAWREQARRQIEREPTWGAYLERRYARNIAKLEDMFDR